MIQNGLSSIFDPDTFVQTFTYASGDGNAVNCAGDGVMTGYGAADGRLVFGAFQNSEFLKGAIGRVHASKIAKIIDMAVRHGAPFVLFMNTAGARVEEGLDVLNGYGEIMKSLSSAIGQIPTICVIQGDCFGAAATVAALFDFVLMCKEDSFAAVSTPETIKAQDHTVTKMHLAGADVCAANGFCTLLAENDEDLTDKLRKMIAFLPDSSESGPDDYDGSTDDFNRPCPFCASVNGSNVDVREVMKEITDHADYLELWADYAPNMVTAFARFGGRVTGILANQPVIAEGKLDEAACKKAASFIDFCDRFGIPLLSLTNCGGFVSDLQNELRGFASSTAILASAFANARVPKLNMVIGKAYGTPAVLMNSRQLGADYVYAWDNAEICVTAPEIGALLCSREEITAARHPNTARSEAIRNYRATQAAPVLAAQKGFIDDIIAPVQTRARIISIFMMM